MNGTERLIFILLYLSLSSLQRATVEVVGHKAHGAVPEPGSVVIARVSHFRFSLSKLRFYPCISKVWYVVFLYGPCYVGPTRCSVYIQHPMIDFNP